MGEKTVLLASGIISERADDVMECFEQNGLRIIEKSEENGWCSMAVMLK
jgi:ribosomal protein L11 methylase PrmA